MVFRLVIAHDLNQILHRLAHPNCSRVSGSVGVGVRVSVSMSVSVSGRVSVECECEREREA